MHLYFLIPPLATIATLSSLCQTMSPRYHASDDATDVAAIPFRLLPLYHCYRFYAHAYFMPLRCLAYVILMPFDAISLLSSHTIFISSSALLAFSPPGHAEMLPRLLLISRCRLRWFSFAAIRRLMPRRHFSSVSAFWLITIAYAPGIFTLMILRCLFRH